MSRGSIRPISWVERIVGEVWGNFCHAMLDTEKYQADIGGSRAMELVQAAEKGLLPFVEAYIEFSYGSHSVSSKMNDLQLSVESHARESMRCRLFGEMMQWIKSYVADHAAQAMDVFLQLVASSFVGSKKTHVEELTTSPCLVQLSKVTRGLRSSSSLFQDYTDTEGYAKLVKQMRILSSSIKGRKTISFDEALLQVFRSWELAQSGADSFSQTKVVHVKVPVQGGAGRKGEVGEERSGVDAEEIKGGGGGGGGRGGRGQRKHEGAGEMHRKKMKRGKRLVLSHYVHALIFGKTGASVMEKMLSVRMCAQDPSTGFPILDDNGDRVEIVHVVEGFTTLADVKRSLKTSAIFYSPIIRKGGKWVLGRKKRIKDSATWSEALRSFHHYRFRVQSLILEDMIHELKWCTLPEQREQLHPALHLLREVGDCKMFHATNSNGLEDVFRRTISYLQSPFHKIFWADILLALVPWAMSHRMRVRLSKSILDAILPASSAVLIWDQGEKADVSHASLLLAALMHEADFRHAFMKDPVNARHLAAMLDDPRVRVDAGTVYRILHALYHSMQANIDSGTEFDTIASSRLYRHIFSIPPPDSSNVALCKLVSYMMSLLSRNAKLLKHEFEGEEDSEASEFKVLMQIIGHGSHYMELYKIANEKPDSTSISDARCCISNIALTCWSHIFYASPQSV
eukprot:g3498.t1